MYRACANLKLGKRDVMRGRAFSSRDMAASIAGQLIEAGKLAVVHAPPISEIPVLREYAAALAAAGVTMCDEFVDTDPGTLAGVLGLEAARVRALQEAICRTLDAPQPKG